VCVFFTFLRIAHGSLYLYILNQFSALDAEEVPLDTQHPEVSDPDYIDLVPS